MTSSVNEIMWSTQDVLHKRKQVVPGTLFLLSASLVVCRHMTHSGPENEPDFIKSFLAMIVLQMLPLVALEMKIMQCADPVGLFCKFATPVTLIHACFLMMRVLLYLEPHSGVHENMLWYSGAGVVGAFWIMQKAYSQSLSSIFKCNDVWMLISLAVVAAVGMSYLDGSLSESTDLWSLIVNVLRTSNTYVEIVAFVPAVWMVYGEDYQSVCRFQKGMDTKMTATAFFIFLIAFYVTEDLLSAYDAYEFSALASCAHFLHFILLVDFSCYILAHLYNPEKLVGSLRKWLPSDTYYV